MGENEIAKKGDPQTPGQTPEGKDKSTSPETYTKEQLQKLISDTSAEAGRKHKAEMETVIKERDSLKSELANIQTEIEDVKAEREGLQSELDDMSSGNPAKQDYLKMVKELRVRENQLNKEKQSLEGEKQAHSERIKIANETNYEINTWVIAAEYEGGNPVKLKDLCDIMNANTLEQIRKVADTLWTKGGQKTEEPKGETLKVYSGATQGGAPPTLEKQLKERYPTMYK